MEIRKGLVRQKIDRTSGYLSGSGDKTSRTLRLRGGSSQEPKGKFNRGHAGLERAGRPIAGNGGVTFSLTSTRDCGLNAGGV